MARPKSSIFVQKAASKATIAFKASAELKERADDVQKRLAEISPELKFDVPDILESALKEAVKAAEVELEKLEADKKG